MLTLLITSIFSFIAAHFSQGVQIFQDKQDKNHELAVMQLQLQAQQIIEQDKLTEIGAQSVASVTVAAIDNDTKNSGIRWLEVYKGMIRPTIALSVIATFEACKFVAVYYFVHAHSPVFQILDALWTTRDDAILGVIIGFYFGGRSIDKATGADN